MWTVTVNFLQCESSALDCETTHTHTHTIYLAQPVLDLKMWLPIISCDENAHRPHYHHLHCLRSARAGTHIHIHTHTHSTVQCKLTSFACFLSHLKRGKFLTLHCIDCRTSALYCLHINYRDQVWFYGYDFVSWLFEALEEQIRYFIYLCFYLFERDRYIIIY